MNALFYDEWTKKRLDKIYGIFGKRWFANKDILELGCGYGNIGIELTKIGANVVFSDIRKSHLLNIEERLRSYDYVPECAIIDQNLEYNLDRKFDLVINFGVIYHLQNWKNDLKCALNHSNLMILESSVWPGIDKSQSQIYQDPKSDFESVDGFFSRITQEEVEEELVELGCKFIRLDDPSLNVDFSWYRTNYLIRCVYDWTYENYNNGTYQYHGHHNYDVHYKRLWLVLK